ncbi:hypothetical protein [Actinomadura sp. 7K507]|uniref:hypothetical protein n=1 Tax=Actinomadura sp. 7K507 TaxID=2530365 RepID=UPI0010537B47|nr:hypothetical protein [Actinomadura sp. 7K507]TDC89143.1 hypothetical protein E1285_17005 [Actinomadura sp. 7K507]
MKSRTHGWNIDLALKRIAEGTANGWVEGWVKGWFEGASEVLLIVLEARGFAIDDDLRERIASCRDPEQMHTWARRAATAESLDEIFS